MAGLVAISSLACLKVSEMTDRMTPKQNYEHETARRAYHEAGHALAARQLGLRLTEVSLDAATTMTPQSHSGRRRSCAVDYAGPVAEQHFARLTSDECAALWQDAWTGDRRHIEALQLIDAERVKARERAKWLVATHWRKIDALAKALIEHDGPITGDEMNALLRGVYFF
jgi:hypothetical protein